LVALFAEFVTKQPERAREQEPKEFALWGHDIHSALGDLRGELQLFEQRLTVLENEAEKGGAAEERLLTKRNRLLMLQSRLQEKQRDLLTMYEAQCCNDEDCSAQTAGPLTENVLAKVQSQASQTASSQMCDSHCRKIGNDRSDSLDGRSARLATTERDGICADGPRVAPLFCSACGQIWRAERRTPYAMSDMSSSVQHRALIFESAIIGASCVPGRQLARPTSRSNSDTKRRLAHQQIAASSSIIDIASRGDMREVRAPRGVSATESFSRQQVAAYRSTASGDLGGSIGQARSDTERVQRHHAASLGSTVDGLGGSCVGQARLRRYVAGMAQGAAVSDSVAEAADAMLDLSLSHLEKVAAIIHDVGDATAEADIAVQRASEARMDMSRRLGARLAEMRLLDGRPTCGKHFVLPRARGAMSSQLA